MHIEDVLRAGYAELDRAPARLQPVDAGLINATYSWGEGYVVQRLSPIFAAEVNLDIAALVGALRGRGVPVPAILMASTGQPWLEVAGHGVDDGVWRVLTKLPGRTIHRIERPSQAAAAARMLARFHGALRGVEHTFAFARAGMHDTPKHLATLQAALATHTGHRLWREVRPVADEIVARWQAWGPQPELPRRIGHGDPKVSNFLFGVDDSSAGVRGSGTGAFAGDAVVGVIDLDTMGWTTLDAELGDALRSWCNTQDESGPEPQIDEAVWGASLEAYRDEAREWVTGAELAAIPAGVERICLELSARFAADALNEAYFGWSPHVAPTRGEHNLVRARNQLGLARAAQAMRRAR